jgi:hypothetical protein
MAGGLELANVNFASVVAQHPYRPAYKAKRCEVFIFILSWYLVSRLDKVINFFKSGR